MLTAPINQLQLSPGSAVTLLHCSWVEFETLLREWPQRRLLPDDPPPDLALEIDLTSKTLLTAYRYLAVPEVWIYDASQLSIYHLWGEEYHPAPVSQFFGAIPLTERVPHFIERAWQVGSFQALEEWENYCYNWADGAGLKSNE